jgi:hypothetical protein
LGTQDTERRPAKQINVRENRRGNQEWTIQRNWKHWGHKTQDEDKQCKKHNTENRNVRFSLTFICFVFLRPVSCVPNVASFSGLFIFLIAPSVFSNAYWFYLVEQIWRKRFECEIVNKDRRTGNKWY